MSYIDQEGEWKNRKITVMGVLRSFISQLRPGQDLTRVSLPAVLLHPYSMLEVIGHRELSYFEVLNGMNHEEDPYERFLIVIKWFLSTVQQETFHKKPYNPVLGETHEAWVESENGGRTCFVSEQVSHHPPISAFVVSNYRSGITVSSNLSFNVRFGGNNIFIVTEGTVIIKNRWEQYEMTKFTPDLAIKNVLLWGPKRIFWLGEVTLSCPSNRYSATIRFGERGNDNTITATIYQMSDEDLEDYDLATKLLELDGKAGGLIYSIDPITKQKKEFINVETLKKPLINYLAPEEQDSLASLNVWKEVSKHIIENDMDRADEAKKLIEAAQRQRSADKKEKGEEHLAKYFHATENGWLFSGKSILLNGQEESSEEEKEIQIPSDDEVEVDEQEEEEREKFLEETEKEEPLIQKSRSTSNIPSLSIQNTSSSLNNNSKKRDQLESFTRSPLRRFYKKSPDEISATDKRKFSQQESRALAKEGAIISGWMKMRSSMKVWINRWFVLKPGSLIYYKNDKAAVTKLRCAGILRLSNCRLKERPPNRDGEGFSFKIYHLKHYPIYQKYGLRGEMLKTAMLPVSWDYCILRVSSERERKYWMDSINEQIQLLQSEVEEKPEKNVPILLSSDEDEEFIIKTDPVVTTSSVYNNLEKSLEGRELAENLFTTENIPTDSLKQFQEKAIKMNEELKSELNLRVLNMERRIFRVLDEKLKVENKLSLTHFQLFALIIISIVFGKLLSSNYI